MKPELPHGSTVPFFLQAANNGIPVIDLHIPPVFSQRYDDLLQRARDSGILPTLGQLFQTFDAAMHIPTDLQNSLLAHIPHNFGQELELLLAEIFMDFAPQQYWDRQQIPTPAGARMRPQLSRVTGATPAGGNQQPPSSTDDRTPSCDTSPRTCNPTRI